MLLYVYSAVILLCFITFRNWRAVVVAVLPLLLTSILCEALMVLLNIGVKVATLPVIALGLESVDYALYLPAFAPGNGGTVVGQSYKRPRQFAGRWSDWSITLAASVVPGCPIKFQADRVFSLPSCLSGA
jgi:hypothetical protein